jgi:hypothetical protein
LFAHGRVLYRFPGSDAARFSPRLAWRLLAELPTAAAPSTLWDPCAGSGLIPALAACFFRHRFASVIGTDIDGEAAACTARNLALVTTAEAAARRLQEAHGRSRQNAKSAQRWGAVADYLDSLLPAITAPDPPSVHAVVASAFALPTALAPAPAPVHFVSDLPYERATATAGGTPSELIAALLGRPPCTVTVVLPTSMAAALPPRVHGSVLAHARCRGGRTIVRAQAAVADHCG